MSKNIDSTAKIHDGCDIHPSVKIGSYSIIYPGVKIKKDVKIEDHTIIGKRPSIGKNQMDLETDLESTIIQKGVFVGSNVIIYSGVKIGEDSYLADKSFIREGVKISENVVIGTGVTVSYNSKISSGVKIMTSSNIGGNMEIGEDSFIGVHVCSFNDNTPFKDKERDEMHSAKIGKRVMIGSNSTILPEIQIESDNIIGAGAVVTKSIEGKNGVYLGTPAKKVKKKNE